MVSSDDNKLAYKLKNTQIYCTSANAICNATVTMKIHFAWKEGSVTLIQ